jgi:hypothetical protein
MTEATKAIIDYAADDNGAEMRNALYSAIQDKVMAHIDAKKQEIAHTLIAPREEPAVEEQE